MAIADQFGVGYRMNRSKPLLFLLAFAVVSLPSCSGLPKPPVPGGGGTATVSLTLVADTPPASPSLLSYKVTATQVTLTPTTGAAFTFTPSPALVFDLMRLQSDSAFVATLLNVATGTYSSITLSLGSPQITFLNNTSATITNASSASGACVVGAICTISPNVSGQPQVSTAPFPITLFASGKTGLGIDFNLNNSITVSGGTMTVTFTPATAGVHVLSAFNLPRNSSLTGNQLDLIEDFVGVVSVSGQTVTLTSPTRGTLTATATSSTNFDPDPTGTLCPAGTIQLTSCVASNQAASMDVILKSDGTLSIQEIEPLLAALQDTVEGIVVAINQSSQTQFSIVTTDKILAATNSLISGLHVGDLLTVNIPNAKTFLADTKGLPIASQFSGDLSNFTNANNTSAMRPGQTLAVHVTVFTAASGTTPASSAADTVTLRWSRFTATPVVPFTPSTFNLTAFPSYFFPVGTAQVQAFAGTPGTKGTTNFEGIADASFLDPTKPVAQRALFIENSTNSALPAFFAAKVRQH